MFDNDLDLYNKKHGNVVNEKAIKEQKLREKVINSKEKRDEILLELGITPTEDLAGMNFHEIVTVKILEPIFDLKNRILNPDPKIMEELKDFKYAEVLARFPRSVRLEKIKDSVKPVIDKTMTWHLNKFRSLKNKKQFFSKNPLKAWLLEKNELPIGEATLRQKIDHLLSKKDLMKKMGITPMISRYNRSKDEIKKLATIEKQKLKKDTSEEIKKGKKKDTEAIEEEEIKSKREPEEVTGTINFPVLNQLLEEIKKLNKNIEKNTKALEEFSAKF